MSCASPEEVRIGETRHMSSWGNPDGANPDRNVYHVSSGGGVPTRGATETLNTPRTRSKPPEKSLRNQYRLPIAKKLAQQARNNQQSKHKRGKDRDRECTECKLANGDENPQCSHCHGTGIASRNPRNSLTNEEKRRRLKRKHYQ